MEGRNHKNPRHWSTGKFQQMGATAFSNLYMVLLSPFEWDVLLTHLGPIGFMIVATWIAIQTLHGDILPAFSVMCQMVVYIYIYIILHGVCGIHILLFQTSTGSFLGTNVLASLPPDWFRVSYLPPDSGLSHLQMATHKFGHFGQSLHPEEHPPNTQTQLLGKDLNRPFWEVWKEGGGRHVHDIHRIGKVPSCPVHWRSRVLQGRFLARSPIIKTGLSCICPATVTVFRPFCS